MPKILDQLDFKYNEFGRMHTRICQCIELYYHVLRRRTHKHVHLIRKADDSYQPLARIDYACGSQKIFYYQIHVNGLPEEMTDNAGNINAIRSPKLATSCRKCAS
ncbi:hypothetical protein AwWohl_15030 [Gammaproteobacteria bacterium]|nr:hypothetical protein AwWohl_15030 [Gammaproteobacteria bacterium]